MQFSRLRLLSVLLLLASLFAVTGAVVARDKHSEAKITDTDEHRRALQALNRLTFGSRPGDVERVEETGVDKWIEQQLHPEKINDAALAVRLSQYRTLRMSAREMTENFPPQPLVKAVMDGKAPMPSDTALRAIYESQITRLRNQNAQKQATQNAGTSMMGDDDKAAVRAERDFAEQRAGTLLQLPPDKRYQEILAMNPDDRDIIARRLPEPGRMQLIAGFTPEQRETVMALGNPAAVVQDELMSAKLLRAIYSERQLEEVMTDFWFNHFNVFLGKGADRYMITSYERDVLRPRALGKFKDLLAATAKSPAMLFYLDNWVSIGPESDFALHGNARPRAAAMPRPRRRAIIYGIPFPPPPRPHTPRPENAKKKQNAGLNENYARELMELHTLGVNGGYTQKDVTEVARVFTGWTLKEPRQGGDFEFDGRKHEPGDKFVLGHRIKSHGEKEGREVLNILAHHPSTARFISTELAQRFVSDDPPSAIVDRMTKTFLKKDGDIREVLRTMFDSPEFWAPQTYRARVKTPLEFIASAVRASGAEVNNPRPLMQALNRMGMPLYGAQPPTGYKTTADSWVGSSALLNRMNFALTLAANKLPGVIVPDAAVVKDETELHRLQPQEHVANEAVPASDVLAQFEKSLLAGEVSQQTTETILKQLTATQPVSSPPKAPNTALIIGLLMGSPEFQRK